MPYNNTGKIDATTNGNKSSGTNFETISETVVQRPKRIRPWAANVSDPTKNGTVWFHMEPRKIINQFSKGARAQTTIGSNSHKFVFMAPMDIQENHVHTWSEYDSVASRLAQKVKSGMKLIQETKGLINTFEKGIEAIGSNIKEGKGVLTAGSVADQMKSVYSSVQGHTIPAIKIDTPLYYTASNRRQIVLEFLLVHENLDPRDPEKDIIKVVRDLMKYAAPELKTGIDIEFPYMFKLYTEPVRMIYYPTCVLQAVQPTYTSPYINGVPSSCRLQLTFQDMSPLYRETIERGTTINVVNQEYWSRSARQEVPTNIIRFQPRR